MALVPRGGARSGSGPKPGPNPQKVDFNVKIPPDLKAWFEENGGRDAARQALIEYRARHSENCDDGRNE